VVHRGGFRQDRADRREHPRHQRDGDPYRQQLPVQNRHRADRALWFTEGGGNKIGRLDLGAGETPPTTPSTPPTTPSTPPTTPSAENPPEGPPGGPPPGGPSGTCGPIGSVLPACNQPPAPPEICGPIGTILVSCSGPQTPPQICGSVNSLLPDCHLPVDLPTVCGPVGTILVACGTPRNEVVACGGFGTILSECHGLPQETVSQVCGGAGTVPPPRPLSTGVLIAHRQAGKPPSASVTRSAREVITPASAANASRPHAFAARSLWRSATTLKPSWRTSTTATDAEDAPPP